MHILIKSVRTVAFYCGNHVSFNPEVQPGWRKDGKHIYRVFHKYSNMNSLKRLYKYLKSNFYKNVMGTIRPFADWFETYFVNFFQLLTIFAQNFQLKS